MRVSVLLPHMSTGQSRRIDGAILVKSSFEIVDGAESTGCVFTDGFRGRGMPEVVMTKVSANAKATVEAFFRTVAEKGTPIPPGKLIPLEGEFLATKEVTLKQRAHLLSTCMDFKCCAPEDLCLVRIACVPRKDEFEDEASETRLLEEAVNAKTAPCTSCQTVCSCEPGSGSRHLCPKFDGDQVSTGIYAEVDGMYKVHADGTRHKMTAKEYQLDNSLFDNALIMVPDDPKRFRIKRHDVVGAPKAGSALLFMSLFVKRSVAKGAAVPEEAIADCVKALPDEVRTGDIVFRHDARCKDLGQCGNCIDTLEVVAVHAEGRGLVVVPKNSPVPFRVADDTILLSVRGPHWQNGLRPKVEWFR